MIVMSLQHFHDVELCLFKLCKYFPTCSLSLSLSPSTSLYLPLASHLLSSIFQSHLSLFLHLLYLSLSVYRFALHTLYENSQNIFYCIRLFANSRSLPTPLPPPAPLGVLFHAIRYAVMQLSFCFVGKRICHLSAADVGNGNGEKA